MNDKEKQAVRELVSQGLYEEARTELQNFKNDRDARQWLITLDDIVAQDIRRTKNINQTAVQRLDANRWVVNVALFAVLFIITRSALPGIIYWLYDWRFNRKEKLTPNEIVIGVVASLGIYFGLSVLILALPAILRTR